MKAWNTWERVLLVLLVLLLVVFGVTQPGFISPQTLADSTFTYSEKGVLALALSNGLKLGDLAHLAHLALPQPSAAAALIDLADQFHAQRKPPDGWRTRLPRLSR